MGPNHVISREIFVLQVAIFKCKSFFLSLTPLLKVKIDICTLTGGREGREGGEGERESGRGGKGRGDRADATHCQLFTRRLTIS